jgi:Spy/CpxP family protein refolding chaperone
MSAHRSPISIAVGLALLICAAGTSGASTPAPRHSSAHSRHSLSGLEAGVQRLAIGLNLTPAQQSRVRAILWKQHLRIERVWSESTVPAADRVNTTQQLNRETGDLIRAVLTEHQRKLYNPPGRDPRSYMKDGHSIEDWIQAAGAQ